MTYSIAGVMIGENGVHRMPRAFSSYLHHDPDYKSVPKIVDEEQLLERVKALRNGDLGMVKPIVLSLMRLVLSCVRETHSNNDELIGVALLTLQESVIDAQTQLTDNNIIPYVLCTVRHRLKDCLAENSSVRVAARTIRHRKSKGEKSPSTIQTPIIEDLLARPEEPSLELRERLESLVRSHRQRAVMDLKSQSYTFAEISGILKIGEATALREIHDLEKRYNAD